MLWEINIYDDGPTFALYKKNCGGSFWSYQKQKKEDCQWSEIQGGIKRRGRGGGHDG